MEIRKLVKSGPGSHVLSLPKAWLDRHHLSKGDLLYIEEGHDASLKISPTAQKRSLLRPSCAIDATEQLVIIKRKIIAAYIENCDTITIGGGLSVPARQEIEEIVNQLAGLEILLQTPKQLLIKDMLSTADLSIRDTVRKLDTVLQLMFDDLKRAFQNEDVAARVWERDQRELNKLYFLAFRLIKIALEDAEWKAREQLDNFHLISHLRLIVILEDIGDQIKHICTALREIKNQKFPELERIVQLLMQDYRDMMGAYYQRNREAAYRYYLNHRNVNDACNRYAMKNRNLAIAAVLQKFKQISKLTEDISKIIRYL